MHRAQVLIEEWQYQTLKSMSERQKRSISELLREILTRHLTESCASSGKKLSEMEGVGFDQEAAGRDHDRFLYRAHPRR